MTADHYNALGVPKDADAATIKRAYRRQSRKHHPDRQGGDHKAMVALNRAFETLSDPEKRARYDKTGEDAPRVPTLDERAREILMRLFDECVERLPDTVDVVMVMRDSLAQARINGEKERRKTASKIEVLEKKRARIKYKGGVGETFSRTSSTSALRTCASTSGRSMTPIISTRALEKFLRISTGKLKVWRVSENCRPHPDS